MSTASGFRKPRQNESLVLSLNGSPLRLDDLLRRVGGTGANDEADDNEAQGQEREDAADNDEVGEDEDDAGLGLLDEEEVMRQMERAKGGPSRA